MLEYLKRTRKVQAFHRLHFSQNGDYIMEMKPQPKRNGFATFSLVLAIAALAPPPNAKPLTAAIVT